MATYGGAAASPGLRGRRTSLLRIGSNPPLNADLRDLVQGWPGNPYGSCPGVAPAAQADYVLSRLNLAREKGAITYARLEDAQPQALLQLEPLPWESEILGFPAARIAWWIASQKNGVSRQHREELLRLALREASQKDVRYITARLPACDLEGIHLLEEHGFRLVDGLLTFGAAPSDLPPRCQEGSGNLRCEGSTPEDVAALGEIAASSFSVDRFHADPWIPKEKADELHRRWVMNSCAGSANCVLVARTTEPIGFTTLSLDEVSKTTLGLQVGIVVLVAVSSRRRQSGVARELTRAAIEWFRQAGCAWVEVGTQLANIRASRLYQAVGFKLVGSSVTLRGQF